MAKETSLSTLPDYWIAPKYDEQDEAAAIVPIGFVCTSFTFDADFFDEECITRFLSMETEKENDGAAYLVEREEKLAGLHAGIVLVDQHHCKGSRSLRWDLVPCRVYNGIMHAKITVLQWSHCIRLIIGSANLTPSGYCINQEIFGVFDYVENNDADLRLMNDILDYLQHLAYSQCGNTVRDRFDKLLAEIRVTLENWNIQERKYGRDEIAVRALLVSPQEKNGLQSLREIWNERTSSPPDHAFVTSPFFDETETATTPSQGLAGILKQRGEVSITYQLTTEPYSGTDGRLIANGPSFLQHPPKTSCSIYFTGIDEQGLNEDKKPVPRPLHLKTIWLQNDDMHLFMTGSSNFTSAAFGLGRRVNYEANLVYTVSESRNKKACKMLMASHIEGKELDPANLVFRQRPNEDEPSEESEEIFLPRFFGEAVVRKSGEAFLLEINFCSEPEKAPKDFEISYETNKQVVLLVNEAQWIEAGKQKNIAIEWNQSFIPDHLLVRWFGSIGFAFWPVVVDSQISLPPVDALRNLSLDALLYILSSSQPLYRLLNAIERITGREKERQKGEVLVDAHKLVDTSGFLLQRTRRISYAMRALAARLEKPVFTLESLKWRLYGPIGVQSLIDAIGREAKSPGEKGFLLAELALELSRISPKTTEISLKADEVRSMIRNVVQGLVGELGKDVIQDPMIGEYSSRALNKALNEF